MSAWQTVGKRSATSKVFDGEKGFDSEFPELENPRSMKVIAGVAENAENPLRAVLEAMWFPILSRSDLSPKDLNDVLHVLGLVIDRTSPSKELSEFLLRTLEHPEVKSALLGTLRRKCYELEHLIVMCRYIELIKACWTGEGSSPKTRFKSIALAFHREFVKTEHTSVDADSFALTTKFVKDFLGEFEAEEFEEKPISGYPSSSSPPDDFRLIPTYPRTQDIDGGLPFLRPNLVKGSFKSLNDYLDIHYRLLREEYIGALRDGICNLRNGHLSHDLILFKGEKYTGGDNVDKEGTITLKITSDKSRIMDFKSGVLVALPRDGFHVFVYLTCLESRAGIVKLEFCNSSDGLSFNPTRVHELLVLQSAYYEAFRHTLDALKSIVQLPFQSSIVEAKRNQSQPEHWRRVDKRTVLMDTLSMNDSQREAFCRTLSQKVCLIQGPPGTGKTYVGLRIVQSVLKHSVTETPVLVVCYTNHALDQFLEGMLDFTSSIVRIGGWSKSEKLEEYNFERVRSGTCLSRTDRRKTFESYKRIELRRQRLLRDEHLLGIIQGRTFFSRCEISKLSEEFSRAPDYMEFLEVSKLCKAYAEEKEFSGRKTFSSAGVDSYIAMKMCSGDLTEQVIADRMRKTRILNRFAFDRISEKLKYKFCKTVPKPRQQLTLNEKWRFYATLHWKKATEDPGLQLDYDDVKDTSRFEQKRQKIQERLAESHKRHSDQLTWEMNSLKQLRAELTAAMLRSKKIIGLTTTGAVKRRDLLRALNCEIIVVEEAAEILESHLVAVLPEKTQQMILIGDHKQLPPCINNYTLEKSFNFGVSLFERLVNNGLPLVMLNEQHRMRSQFLKLLVPHFYDNITSSPEVENLESIRGMARDLQFLSHKRQERSTGRDSASKSNAYEASMVIALLEHLSYQGYEPNQIVVLCAYSGQQQYVSTLVQASKGFRISTIDDYQGEECDIVIVSFVRCNPKNDIGFLAKPNRVCVALSRARKGLFCFGDVEAYAARSPVWRGILNTLQDLGCVKPFFELKCSTHGTLAQVRAPGDFAKHMPRGRCQKACGFLFQCGHSCPDPCHSGNTHPKCRKPCSYTYPACGHPCLKRCDQEHGTCQGVVPKLLTCGHTGYGPCSTPADEIECQERCGIELECGHRCGSPCSKPCTVDCMVKVPVTRECGHEAVVACFDRERQRTQTLCPTKVNVKLNCGHPARVQCRRSLDIHALTSECERDVENVELPCGHSQTMLCLEHQELELYSCSQTVEVRLLCGHPRTLPCGQSKNYFVISEETRECLIPTEVLATCGHSVSVCCNVSADAARLCKRRVEVKLPCGHSCAIACGSARDEHLLRALTRECGERVFVEAPCTHLVEVACGNRKNETLLQSLCTIVVNVTPTCGHPPLSVVCSSSRSPGFVSALCNVGRTVQLTCDHSVEVRCSETRSVGDISGECKEIVENVLSCHHVVEQTCNGTRGDPRAKCARACEFVHRCGHTCIGNCAGCRGGQTHKPCKLDCTRILLCGHRCKGVCSSRCPPCEAPCQRLCAHGQCEKKCGEPCSSKSQICRRKGVDHCPHQSCSAKTCWDCECEPCEQKCNKKQGHCQHPCEGACSEPCVPCFRCKPKRLRKLFGNAILSGRFLRVPGCGHLVDAEIMDQVMASWRIGTPRCINCDEDIPIWRRYNCVYNRIHRKAKLDEGKKLDAKRARENLATLIDASLAELSTIELKEDSTEREMVRHYARQILEDLNGRLRCRKSDDVTLCDLVYQVVKSLVEGHEDVFRIAASQDESVLKKTFLLTRDVFEDLAAMVDDTSTTEGSWTVSVLDDIACHALRLKFVLLLPSTKMEMRAQFLNMIFAGGRFCLSAANALLKDSNPELRVQPFYDFQLR